MVLIDKEYYFLDIEAIENFIFKKDDSADTYDEEIVIDGEGKAIQKTQFKKDGSDKLINLRYDIIKAMMDNLYVSGVESEDGNIKYQQDIEETSIGLKLVFNTMLVNGFIKDKLD